MSMPESRYVAVLLLMTLAQPAAAAGSKIAGPNLGQAVPNTEAAQPYPSIYPDGRGLPAGHGNAVDGRKVYDAQCTACHGSAGRGGSGGQLISHGPLTGPEPDPAVDNYWPFATTLFDFTRRAMPMTAPGTLSNDEVYAVTAYLLNLSGVIGENDDINAETLPKIRMPNRDGFVWIDVPKSPR
jgi:S-disulfanyl-L-cysteine oxidoreductase SoxD